MDIYTEIGICLLKLQVQAPKYTPPPPNPFLGLDLPELSINNQQKHTFDQCQIKLGFM